jgi:hypothetical protein
VHNFFKLLDQCEIYVCRVYEKEWGILTFDAAPDYTDTIHFPQLSRMEKSAI